MKEMLRMLTLFSLFLIYSIMKDVINEVRMFIVYVKQVQCNGNVSVNIRSDRGDSFQ